MNAKWIARPVLSIIVLASLVTAYLVRVSIQYPVWNSGLHPRLLFFVLGIFAYMGLGIAAIWGLGYVIVWCINHWDDDER